MFGRKTLCAVALASVALAATWRMARAIDVAPTATDSQILKQSVQRGVDYLLTKGQAPDGSYSAKVSPAITAICTAALLRSGRSPDDAAIARSLKYLEGFV